MSAIRLENKKANAAHKPNKKLIRANKATSKEKKSPYQEPLAANKSILIPFEDYHKCQHLSSNNHMCSSFTIATYNILYDLTDQEKVFPQERFKVQFQQILPSLDADIIGLNEVTVTYFEQLLQQPWVQQGYHVIYDPQIKDENCDKKNLLINVILTRLPVLQVHLLKFSKFKRDGVMAILDLCINNEKIKLAVLNIHLKATADSEWLRKKQCKHMFNLMFEHADLYDDLIIIGDTNIRSEAENRFIDPGYLDVWKQLRPYEPGYTFDPELNKMIRRCWPLKENPFMRLDRILVKIRDSTKFKPKSIEMFATSPVYSNIGISSNQCNDQQAEFTQTNVSQIPNEYEHDKHNYLFPSDHFGLKAAFDII